MTTLNQLQTRKAYPFLFGLLAVILGSVVGYYSAGTPSLLEAGAIIIGIIILLLIITDLDIGLVILVTMNYLRVSQIGINYYGAPPTALPLTLLLILAVAVRWILTKQAPKGWTSGAILVGLYGLVIFMSTFVADDYPAAVASLKMFIGDGIVAITVMMMMQRARSLRGVIWGLIACGILLGIVNVFQFFTNTFDNFYLGLAQVGVQQQIIGDYSDFRLGGQIGDPNYFAEILLLIIPMAFYQIWAEKKIILRFLATFCTFICTLTLILTYSRGGFLALMAVAVASMFLMRPKISQILLIIAVAIVIFRYIPTSYTDRILTVVDIATNKIDVREEGSFRGRYGAMLTAFEMFKDHPFFGVGIDNYIRNYVEYASGLGVARSLDAVSTHNLYLEIAAETGLAGIGTFAAVVVFAFAGLKRAQRIFKKLNRPDLISCTMGIMLSLIGFFASAMFIHGSYPRFFWMFMGIAMSVPIIADNMKEEKEKEENEKAGVHFIKTHKDNIAAGQG